MVAALRKLSDRDQELIALRYGAELTAAQMPNARLRSSPSAKIPTSSAIAFDDTIAAPRP